MKSLTLYATLRVKNIQRYVMKLRNNLNNTKKMNLRQQNN